jgi:hypothetical protein
VFEESGLARCPDTDYDTDVEPWIGERAALALLPGRPRPRPVVALAVTDEDAAASALARLVDCGPRGRSVGFAVGADHVLIAESDRVAEAALDAADDKALAADPAFERWTSEAGERGFVTAYLAPEAPAQLASMRGRIHGGFGRGPVPGMGPGLGPPVGRVLMPGFGGSEQLDRLTRDFEGLGAVVRFADGTVEVEVAAAGLPTPSDPDAVSGIRELPATTGAGFSMALEDEWLREALDGMGEASRMPLDQLLGLAEARTGLNLPEDVETLLGENMSVAVDGDAVDARVDGGAGGGVGRWPMVEGQDPAALRAGVRVRGDADEIVPVLDRVRAALGPAGRRLVVETGPGTVAFGFNADYVAELARAGDLDAERTFQEALPERDRSPVAGYVDFEAGDGWLERLLAAHAQRAEGTDATELRRNLEPLDALGVSAWTDDGVQRGLLRLSTD